MTVRLVSFATLVLFMSVFMPLAAASADGWHSSDWNHHSGYNSDNYYFEYPYARSYTNYGYDNNYNRSYSYGQYATYYTQPSCTITLSNYSRLNGYPPSATLSWWSSGATSAYLSSVGSVSNSGTRTVYPYGQSYTLTVYGPGGTGTCYAANTDVAYQHDYYNYPVYTYGYYTAPVQTYSYSHAGKPYVHLEKLPYTGFDGGPMLNSLYWAVLLGFALVGSYLMFYVFGMRIALVENVARAAHNQIGLVKRAIRR